MRLGDKERGNSSGIGNDKIWLAFKDHSCCFVEWTDWWQLEDNPQQSGKQWYPRDLWNLWMVEWERSVLDNLGRCDIEKRRCKLRDCQHKHYEVSHQCDENEAFVRQPNWNLRRKIDTEVWPLGGEKKKIQKEIRTLSGIKV